jgi:hypothetical protein
MENAGIFTVIWYILWPFGKNVVYFPPFWYIVSRKSGNPAYIAVA